MARSSKEQMASNRQRIISAASELFRSRGYNDVGIADVMKAAGMTQGGFYKHFANKEALAYEAWRAGFESVESFWAMPANERDGHASQPVAAIVEYYLSDHPAEERCPMQGHGEDAARSQDGGALQAVYADGAGALYRTFLSKAGDTMDEQQAKLLFAAMVGANFLGRASGDADWAKELKRAITASIVD
ncbi:TetR/AcrR family transcriptional regulator [Pantoea allii]|nr:TetR/AcrR family transcriptional regulator [Pantoea allii]THB83536.1 TetR/AcrR family transcriptional regulator [Pantoea allii]